MGYYYTFRGNGYGPFKTYTEAIDDLYKKDRIHEYGGYIWWGIAVVKDRKLTEGTRLCRVGSYQDW